VAVIQDNLDLNRIKQKVILAWHRPEERPTPERWWGGWDQSVGGLVVEIFRTLA
jgi:hypothetical protein